MGRRADIAANDSMERMQWLVDQGQEVVTQLAREGGADLVNAVLVGAMRWQMEHIGIAEGLTSAVELAAAVARAAPDQPLR